MTPPGAPELIIILLIVILLFGVGRISKISKELGSGIRAFKEGLQGENDDEKEEQKPKEAAAKEE
jgi:sec-independent protein translocase protein TatA